MEINQPTLIVVSAPSGAGKTTIIKRTLESIPQLVLSISHTSRLPRHGEQDGKDYFFISSEEFKIKISKGDFLEWAEVHGNFYGTSRVEIDTLIQNGKIAVLDIDVQGALQIKNSDGINMVYIFIEPPSLEELRKRLQNRRTETSESIDIRIQNARKELAQKDRYDYIIINDDLEMAIQAFKEIIMRNLPSMKPLG